MTKNVQPQFFKATLEDRIVANGHKPLAIWYNVNCDKRMRRFTTESK
jgi:hypothetical protein